ncbi:Imm1 family immunity protein [Kutzneria sp. NPDC051319]|uniref:Imm1 family immunity protein n=1 Tax=Kutzneria sp. NPDC051319 TaxID=3155047 RepID=UPI003447A92B
MVDIEVLRRVGRRYYRPGDRVLRQPGPAEVADLLDELCRPDEDPEWWNHGVVGRSDADDGVEFMVAPLTGYVALSWTGTAERSLNPEPFADAPLLPDNNDNDPPLYWPRSSYLPPAEAKKALAEHIVTGAQPTCVTWQPWGFEVRQLPDWLKPEMPEYSGFHLITD